jgi:hypothetical protein
VEGAASWKYQAADESGASEIGSSLRLKTIEKAAFKLYSPLEVRWWLFRVQALACLPNSSLKAEL